MRAYVDSRADGAPIFRRFSLDTPAPLMPPMPPDDASAATPPTFLPAAPQPYAFSPRAFHAARAAAADAMPPLMPRAMLTPILAPQAAKTPRRRRGHAGSYAALRYAKKQAELPRRRRAMPDIYADAAARFLATPRPPDTRRQPAPC